MARKSSQGGAGAAGNLPDNSGITPNLSQTGIGAGAGAQARPRYRDRHEEYVLVTEDDLREAGTVGWLQEGTAGVGLFFLSGAFWLLAALLAEHGNEPEFYPWYFVCFITVVFGGVLTWVGARLFRLKQKRLSKYFPNSTDANVSQ